MVVIMLKGFHQTAGREDIPLPVSGGSENPERIK
jgi:hypothetical protein